MTSPRRVSTLRAMQDTPFTLRFRLGSIPVVVEPWFWIMAFAMGPNFRGPSIVLWVLVVFVSILVHELGHAAASRAFGARASIRLHSFGGLTFPDRRLTRGQDILMTLAGPGAGFALAAIAYAVQWQFPLLMLTPNTATVLTSLLWVNVVWGIVNLFPVPPLDGGHVALALAGPRHERKARMVAVAVSAAIVVLSLSSGQTFRAIMFGLLGYQNLQHLTRASR